MRLSLLAAASVFFAAAALADVGARVEASITWAECPTDVETYFSDLFPSLGLLLIVPIVMALARSRGRLRPLEWELSLILWATVAIGAFFWGLLMFGNLASRTVMHAGTFALPVMAFVACVVGLRAVFPRFAIWWTAIAATLMFALYVPALRPPPATSYSKLAILIVALSLACFVGLVLRDPSHSAASTTSAQDTATP